MNSPPWPLLPDNDRNSSRATILQVRIGSCLNGFRIANWFERLGKFGLNFPGVTIDGIAFPERIMCNEEKMEYSRKAHEYRAQTRAFTVQWLGEDWVGIIEAWASTESGEEKAFYEAGRILEAVLMPRPQQGPEIFDGLLATPRSFYDLRASLS